MLNTDSYIGRPSQFRFRPEKAAEAIDLIARANPGVTQYFVGKILYLADKTHFLDWGRPITFDRYVAMKHGPVPSFVRNMVAASAGANAGMDETRLAAANVAARELNRRVRVELELALNGERHCVYPLSSPLPYRHLSGSDIDALEAVIRDHGGKTFGSLRDMTHKDEAWRAAWSGRAGRKVADIDMANWAPVEERAAARAHLSECALVAT